jgi:threonine dehydrogenase-like Zn-dependent dehydrogenase
LAHIEPEPRAGLLFADNFTFYFPGLPSSVASSHLLSVNQDTFDALIIGCGPGGSSAATFLARAGHRVHILEANGESYRLTDAKRRLKRK